MSTIEYCLISRQILKFNYEKRVENIKENWCLDLESKMANVNSNFADLIDHGYGTIILAVKIRKYHRRKD